MNIDSFTISRFIFLIFIIFISVYFIVENKRAAKVVEKYEDAKTATPPPPTGGSTDKLSNKDEQPANPKQEIQSPQKKYINRNNETEIQGAIMEIYLDLYKSPPSKQELAFYTDFVKARDITREQLLDVIDASAPTLQKTFYITKDANAHNEIFGNENEIIDTYNEILDRNPDRQELYSFAKMMKNDSNFTLAKLRQVLIASEEFKRLERTQSNKVYVNLQSNITDRQLTMLVSKIYVDVTGKEYLDEDTLKFLKKKFVEFELDEIKLAEFISAYIMNKEFEKINIKTVTVESEESKRDNAAIENMKKQLEVLQTQVKTQTTTTTVGASEKGKKESFIDKDGKTIFTDNVFNFFGNETANSEVISSLISRGTTIDGDVDTDKVIDSIKDNAECVFSKNGAEDEVLAKYKQELADYVNERNRSHMKSVCNRNKKYGKYLNADDNMVLYPEFKWSVPQKFPPVCVGGGKCYTPVQSQTALIGTLLNEAEDTKVGSILPLYPPV
jgi:hypothetical protein